MAGSVLAAVSLPDLATFLVAAAIVLAGSLGVVFGRNPIHAALSLVATLFGVAVLFVEENAQFLAAVQIIVYAGAIVVLFLFVIMLLGVDRQERVLVDQFRGQHFVAIGLGALVLAEVLLLGTGHWTTGAHATTGALNRPLSNVDQLGRAIFTSYLLPFEVTSALLVVAVVAAVVLARRPDRGLDEGEGRPADPAGRAVGDGEVKE